MEVARSKSTEKVQRGALRKRDILGAFSFRTVALQLSTPLNSTQIKPNNFVSLKATFQFYPIINFKTALTCTRFSLCLCVCMSVSLYFWIETRVSLW